ncbi:uncharacterized protein SPPG_01978 [Spizellomyces punctatus DAOM BR117]|uniref:Uncharacterized protein n=1 Tax=Spizellomyces punctatus (strain DAOM BR117) TaxID=645134 RepID=A0A0L0HQ14_SPIPD|nr:uncharacterized protein SPPG_01978 [Spizellomyces punctatus DAOM BR117]KND02899.1 hypothetical protein SPPG_01978 [Spizellomyces punctatus DAOM BR117]|eukprot:XP_016610938.1 hypothetical protein SPPG_01978 [Spizellomyces punctatus DAOM BR117]
MSANISNRMKRIVWSPLDGQRLFLVGGNDLRLYEWSPELEGDEAIRLIAVNTDVSHMKCFDWSPHPEFSDLLAVGYTTGRTILTTIQAFNFVSTPSNAHVLSRNPSTSSLLQLPSNPPVSKVLGEFMPRHTRACNVVAFCPTDPHLLVAGLDKVRNDFGLIVWNTEMASSSGLNGAGTPTEPSADRIVEGRGGLGGTSTAVVTDGIRSVFSGTHLGQDIDNVLDSRKISVSNVSEISGKSASTSTSRNPIPSKPVAQYGSSEGISSAAWLYKSSPHLVAGMGLKWIRGYDLRAAGNNTPSLVIPTKAVLGIATDPFHAHRFASFAEDNIIRLWDARNTTEPALTFNAEFRTGITQISWSPIRSGCLAAVGKDSPALKVWDIQETITTDYISSTISRSSSVRVPSQSQGPGPHQLPSPIGEAPSTTSAGDALAESHLPPSVAGAGSVGSDGHGPGPRFDSSSVGNGGTLGSNGTGAAAPGVGEYPVVPGTLSPQDLNPGDDSTIPILWKTRQVRPTSQHIQGFAWIPVPVSDDFSHYVVTATNTKEQQFDITRLPVTYKVSLSPRGDLAVTGGKSITMLLADASVGSALQSQANSVSELAKDIDGMLFLSRQSSGYENFPKRLDHASYVGSVHALHNDISVVMRKRALAGYSMNAEKNGRLLTEDDRDLRELWAWVHRAKRNSAQDRMRINGIDYSGQGIQAVIQDMMAPAASSLRRTFPTASSPATSVSNMSSDPSAEPFVPFISYSNPHRTVALLMCGWQFHVKDDSSDGDGSADETLEQVLQNMEAAGEYEKAAGWALFHSSSLTRAVQALNASKDERLKLVATALAGYSTVPSNKSGSKLWQDLCRSLSSDLKDPYLRSMFALIASDGDWRIVLQERGLSMKDRIGIALRFLNDEDLLAYINKMTNKMVLVGDINGLPLTGLTPAGVDLMEHYLNKTGDVQTAALLLSMVAPGRFLDSRVDDWAETYRTLLDRWQLYRIRAGFDIARQRHLAGDGFVAHTPHPSTPYNANVPPQIYVRCNFCNQPVANGLFASPVKRSTGTAMSSAAPMPVMPGNNPHMAGAAGNPLGTLMIGSSKQKVTSCPNCRKPLPRCALCLLHLGTAAENLQYFSRRDKPSPSSGTDGSALSGFDLWFTWCQTCRHGGHAVHMLQWFEKHQECPVSDCRCRCREI